MQVTETNSEGLKRAYTVIISAADIAEKVEGRLQELGGKVTVPGFRPGKVPLTILKQRFGTSVRGEVLELGGCAFRLSVTQQGLDEETRFAGRTRTQLDEIDGMPHVGDQFIGVGLEDSGGLDARLACLAGW